MQFIARRRFVIPPVLPVQPAIATLLATGAAVAAIAQPLATQVHEPAHIRFQIPAVPALPVVRLGLSHLEPGAAYAGAMKTIAPTPEMPLPQPSAQRLSTGGARLVESDGLAAPAATPLAALSPRTEAPSAALVQPVPGFALPTGIAPGRSSRAADLARAPASTSQAIPMVDDATWTMLTGQTRHPVPESGSSQRMLDASRRAASPGQRIPILGSAAQEAAAAADASPKRAMLADNRDHSAGPEGITRYSQTERGIAFSVPVQVNHAASGTVPLLIGDGENISVKLADILAVLEPVIAAERHEALSKSAAAQEYVTFNDLRAAGITVTFGADDRLILGAS